MLLTGQKGGQTIANCCPGQPADHAAGTNSRAVLHRSNGVIGDDRAYGADPEKVEWLTMAEMFFVQGFRLKGKKLEPDPPDKVRSPEAAIAKAERMAPSRAGVWAYSADIDVETDTYADPVVLFKSGTLPAGLAD